jgi:hypothetical protein
MPSLRQWLPLGFRAHHPQDLSQCHNPRTEWIPIVLDYAAQLADQHFGLYVIQVKVHTPDIASLISRR